jgi:hypothetical protein
MNEYMYETTANEVLADIEAAIADTLAENTELSREDVVRDVAEAILRDVPQRGLKSQVRRRLGI